MPQGGTNFGFNSGKTQDPSGVPWSAPESADPTESGNFSFTTTVMDNSASASPARRTKDAAGSESTPVRAATGSADSHQPPPVAPEKNRFSVKSAAPLPKRPKGRLFVGTLLCSVVAFIAFTAWDTFFRYEAYGSVVGRVIEVSAPWDGVVTSLRFRAGESVRQGDLLATLDNLALRQQLDQLDDRIRMAQATLDARISELKYTTRLDDDRSRKASAEFYELWGNVLKEQTRLTELRTTWRRYEQLSQDGSITQQERDHVRLSEEGQTAKLKKMLVALHEMKKRIADDQLDTAALQHQIKPELVRIEGLQKELSHLRAQIQLGEVRAPVDGRVLRRVRFTGEHAAGSELLLELLEDDSKEIVLYVPQSNSHRFHSDQFLEVRVEPQGDCVSCRVTRLGDRVVAAPVGIERYYRKNAQLVPVHLRPEIENYDRELRLGSEVKLPMARPWDSGS